MTASSDDATHPAWADGVLGRGMQLLVSVRNEREAETALAEGAHIIDAKDPARGALGAVAARPLREVCARVAGARPVSAALGDPRSVTQAARAARRCAAAGVRFVKVGLAHARTLEAAVALVRATVEGGSAGTDSRCGVVAVGYADAVTTAAALDRDSIIEIAATAGAGGVLLDTANKQGPGLPGLIAGRDLARWVERAHQAGLFVALAGKLRPADLAFVRDAGADIVGVRGAVCEGGRAGEISAARVRSIRGMVEALAATAHARPRSAPVSLSIWSAVTISQGIRGSRVREK